MTQEFFIPIDNSLKGFKEHLDYNSRTIFSAEYGDGKTYFLEHFQEKYSEEYEFITLYPVNYQVEDNKDIFELIKRDILVQLVAKNFIKESYEINDSLIAYSYLMNNKRDVLFNLIGGIADLNLGNKIVSSFCSTFTKTFGKLFENFDRFKKEFENATDTQTIIENYLSKIDNTSGIYDYDLITQIITENIINYKESTNKEIILIIEDLDRLDPEHTFRILNILSAHIDRQYHSCNEINNHGMIYNKYAFDKVVIVCDYDNVKNIYHHFYGENTKFEGYISKFTTLEPYKYSLKQETTNYFITHINKITNIDKSIISNFIEYAKDCNLLHNTLNARTIINVLYDLDSQLREKSVIIFENITTRLDCGIIRFFIILKRIGFSNKDLIECANFFDYGYEGIKYLNPFVLWGTNTSFNDKKWFLHQTFFIHSKENGEMEKITFNNYSNNNGNITLNISYSGRFLCSNEHTFLSVKKVIEKILSYIK